MSIMSAAQLKEIEDAQLSKRNTWLAMRAAICGDSGKHRKDVAESGCGELANCVADRLVALTPDLTRLLGEDESSSKARRNVALHNRSAKAAASMPAVEVKRLHRGGRKRAVPQQPQLAKTQVPQCEVFSIVEL